MRGALLVAFSIGCSSGGEKPTGVDDEPMHTGAHLPFAVDDHYVPSGFMGDVESLSLSNATCKLPRPEGAQGECHAFEYGKGTQGWVGVFWQFGDGNWGNAPGLRIASGARRVRWFAASSTADHAVRFMVGISDPTLPNYDGFRLTQEERVGREFAEFSINLMDVNYSGVIGAFGWTSDAPAVDGKLQLYIDDIRWE